MAKGIPSVKFLQAGAEPSFESAPSSFYEMKPFDYKRMNPKRELYSLDKQLRSHLGTVASLPGGAETAKGEFAFKAHGSAVSIAAQPPAWQSYLDALYGAAGFERKSAYGFAGIITVDNSGGATKLALAGEGANSSRYQTGAAIIIDGSKKKIAFVAAKEISGANLILSLDRKIADLGSVSRIYGSYLFALNSSNASQADTSDALRAFSFEQEDFNGSIEGFTGCLCDKLEITAKTKGLVDLKFGFVANFGAPIQNKSSTTTTWRQPAFIVAQNAEIAIDGKIIDYIDEVSLKIALEIKACEALDAPNGRRGWLIVGVKPTLKISARQDEDFAEVFSWFEAGNVKSVSIVFKSEAEAVPGKSLAVFAPRAQIIKPYEIIDGDIQTRSLEFNVIWTEGFGDLAISYV